MRIYIHKTGAKVRIFLYSANYFNKNVIKVLQLRFIYVI